MKSKAIFAVILAGLLSCSHAVVVSSESQQVSLQGSSLRGGAMTALDSFAEVEADSEMGADLGLDLSKQAVAKTGSGPATLAEYCAGPPPAPKMGPGTRVKADWNDYGTMYPGKVKEKNADGTVDIAYDDGFTEKNVDLDDIKVRKKQKFAALMAVKKSGAPADDPACKLQEFLKKLQDKLKKMNGMISEWLSSQRAKAADEPLPKPPPAVEEKKSSKEKAPQGIVKAGSKEEGDELEKLKAELADLDEYIKELEAQEAKYDKQIAAKGAPAAKASEPGVKTVDDLIKEYMGKIAQRELRVDELLQRIKEQKAELASMGESRMSLKDIEDALIDLEKDVADAKKKRDDLEKSGDLDPELASVIDDILKALGKVRKKVDSLLALDAKAKAAKEKAAQDAKDAEAAARKKAREEGKNEDEAAAEAAAAAKKKADSEAKKADLETMKAAAEVEQDLKDAEAGATKLDTGLHPHGDKWWRYRYEHSHIEALMMIFISFLMLFWSETWRYMKHRVEAWSLAPGAVAITHLEESEEDSHGAIYSLWMKYLADQMLVCIFVFLTLWLIAKTALIEYFPIIIKGSDEMRVPHTGMEYRNLALDICTIFFFAIVFYFGLMFSVAHEIRNTTWDLEMLEEEHRSGSRPNSPGPSGRGLQRTYSTLRRTSLTHNLAAHTMGSMTADRDGFTIMQKHFAESLSSMMSRDEPELKEISRLLNDDFNNFPLAKYLKMNIRLEGVELFKFGYQMWVPTIGLFFVLWALHRFAHMGYVRIMGFAGCIVLLMIVCMGYFTRGLLRHMQEEHAPEVASKEKSFHEKFSSETLLLAMLEFSLFFVCYGVARMICQPWMWELHFWPVFILTIVALLSAALFVVIVAPGIPSFIGAMAMPPYVDPYNLEVMKALAENMGQTPRDSPRIVADVSARS